MTKKSKTKKFDHSNRHGSQNSHQINKNIQKNMEAYTPSLKVVHEWYGGMPEECARFICEGRNHPEWTEAMVGKPWFFEEFTPDMAGWLISLPLNEGSYPNRAKSASKIKFIEDLIRRDKYQITNDAFTFDWYGSSGNGQHRLQAIRNVGKIIKGVTIISGIDPKVMLISDTSKPKTEAEWYKAQSFSDPTKMANLVNLYRSWHGLRNQDDWNDTSGPKRLVNKTSELNDRHLNTEFFSSLSIQEKGWAEQAIDMTRNVKKNMVVDWAGLYTLAFTVLRDNDPVSRQAITEFFAELSQEGQVIALAMPDNYPIAQLVKVNGQYHRRAQNEVDFKFPPDRRTQFLIRAWNYYATNRNISNRAMKSPFDQERPLFIERNDPRQHPRNNQVVKFTRKKRKPL